MLLELPSGSPFLEGHRLHGAEDDFGAYQVIIALRSAGGWYSKTWHAEQPCQREVPMETPLVDAGHPGRTARLVIQVSRSVECDRESGFEGGLDYVFVGVHQGAIVDLGTITLRQSYSHYLYNEDVNEGSYNTLPIEERWERSVRFEGDTLELSAAEASITLPEGVSEPADARDIQNLSAARTLTLEELAEARQVTITDGDPIWR